MQDRRRSECAARLVSGQVVAGSLIVITIAAGSIVFRLHASLTGICRRCYRLLPTLHRSQDSRLTGFIEIKSASIQCAKC